MAGLQYNFFPTDFLYPQPTKKASDVTAPQVIVTNNKKPKAGLQYNFFPTDFLYPQPTKKVSDVTTPQVIVTNNKKPKVSHDDMIIKTSSSGIAKDQVKAYKHLFDYSVIEKQT
ncbi:hypothetical protein HanPI659440_Chr01g0010271 [Helianthus annuus]|nr:hypothetical protein HanPI659440_Chr01g0010271 [Helianthus annuus]